MSCQIPLLFEYGYCKPDDMKNVMTSLRKIRKQQSKQIRNDIDDTIDND